MPAVRLGILVIKDQLNKELRMKVYIGTILILALAGCSKDNSLIGTWKIKYGKSLTCPEIKFTRNKMFCGSIVEEVKYEILDDRVIVTGRSDLSKAIGTGISYKVEAHHTISTHNFLGQEIKYSRQSY